MDKIFDEHEIGIRKIPHFVAEQKGLSHRDNFGGWVSIVQQVVSLAQPRRVLPSTNVKIRVAGVERNIETSSMQEVACEQKQDCT
jgi:hypothetical protein